ncbi:UV excision repair protein RAD23 [Monocercomonoides exilis]|uniref:UV excision repair protein RAD23 n=1 Tax=Monocercomonoides exilis TaxID=2049356 RepID=UPI00355A4A19|nr:UV excision repair protein RAD23 [Monocercomonoides exilis]|eukprot:MONOS_3319.1-p1 / transcript=MONOS_3319.1 / gene=MONOS_3319 / organism=Monocercomonoides_exilis_PA203 / gene_product=UV excision repair protein RAD23 homolog / transcript_product=UV excision repair protein RAD23 homolog / location=Mono_scaffold00077:58254-59679(-) / protein_length=451 / sequence_SO=supercontig / SO=protein_coding / is_pseudo=false
MLNLQPEDLKLFLNGKQLCDSKSVEEYSINEGTKLIYLTRKSKQKEEKASSQQPICSEDLNKKEIMSQQKESISTRDHDLHGEDSSFDSFNQRFTSSQSIHNLSNSTLEEPSHQVINSPLQPQELNKHSHTSALPTLESSSSQPSSSSSSSPSYSSNARLSDKEPLPEENNPVEELVGMGFEHSEVQRALRASFGEVATAIEYLMNGIPEDIERQLSEVDPIVKESEKLAEENDEDMEEESEEGDDEYEDEQQLFFALPPTLNEEAIISTYSPDSIFHNDSSSTNEGGEAEKEAGGSAAESEREDESSKQSLAEMLAQFRDHPQIADIRHVFCEFPDSVSVILNEMRQQQPEFAKAVLSDPTEFLDILREKSNRRRRRRQRWQHTIGLFGQEGEHIEQAGNEVVVDVTQEEHEDIQHIMLVTGASDQVAIQAYFACDKNVESAINFIFGS